MFILFRFLCSVVSLDKFICTLSSSSPKYLLFSHWKTLTPLLLYYAGFEFIIDFMNFFVNIYLYSGNKISIRASCYPSSFSPFKKFTAFLVSSKCSIVSSYSIEARHISKISIICSWAILEEVAPLLNVASFAADVCNKISVHLLKRELPYFVILIVVHFFCLASSSMLAISWVLPENEIPTTTSSSPLFAIEVAAKCTSEKA